MEFAGSVAVVTGGAAGIGRATAEALVGKGANVVIWDIAAGVEEVAAQIGATGIRVDIADTAAVREAAAASPSVALLAHCAARPEYGELWSADVAQWDRGMAINLTGSFLVLREISQQMLMRGGSGRIVLVSSANGVVPDRGLGIYGVAKAGVNMLARVAAVELAEHDILVNSILPGPTMTNMGHDRSRPDLATRMLGRLPVKRFCEPPEVAAAILFMLESDWMTGANMAFDGGMQASGPIDFWDLVQDDFPAVASLRG
jgi:NAD(P)-dependent dehydrogenase (short-subunit alcohol dehydrogenase family)